MRRSAKGHGEGLRPSQEAVQKACERAAAQKPKPTSWLMFTYGDAPAAIGGGVGCFFCFKSKPEMLAFVDEYITWVAPGPAAADHDAVQLQVHRIVARATKGTSSLPAVRKRLNSALKTFSQIPWWGTLRDLCRNRDKFSIDVRISFRDQHEDVSPRPSRPIGKSELKEFLQFLEFYGM